jgi:MoaA/NifB/PqqE/SkfB family radical SAM enzyme
MKVFFSDIPDEQKYLEQLYGCPQADRLKAGTNIALCRENFFRVGTIMNNCGFDFAENFHPAPFDNLSLRWQKYLELLENCGINYVIIDEKLDEIFSVLSDNYTFCSESDLLRALGAVCNHAFIGPKYLLVDPTAVCNLDCIYCRLHSPLLKENKLEFFRNHNWDETAYFDWELLQKVIIDARKTGVEQICIVGQGDPTLYPYFRELLSLVREQNLSINLHTNGLAINRSLAEHIVHCDVNTLTVSVSGTDEKSYKLIHPGQKKGVYTRLRNQLKYLNDYKRSFRKQYPDHYMRVEILQVVHRFNYKNMLRMVTDAVELGMDRIWFQMLHVNDFSRFLRLNKEQIAECRFLLQEAKKLAAELGIDVADYMDLQIKAVLTDGTWSKNIFEEYGCLVGWIFSYIYLGADVSFCCGFKVFDNLYEHSFAESWNSELYKKWRQTACEFDWNNNLAARYGEKLLDPFCHNCDNHNFNQMMIDNLTKSGLLGFLRGRFTQARKQFLK